MDKVTSRAIDFLSDNPDVCRQLANSADEFRKADPGRGLDDVAVFMFESFVKATEVDGESPYAKASIMNVILAIAEVSGFEF